ncbi:MAG: hypothetical protein Q9165_001616 [Trypethelium subeluteriae]
MASKPPILITIVTGFLGSGKTTMILSLIPQMKDTRFAILKNEFGDVAVDSQLASTSAISGVREMLNGCICCNQVGQLSDALSTLDTTASPDRILIETSGSAFPATLALEINRLASPTGRYALDGVVSVIDVENWKGYDDTSYTAKIQAHYTDLIVYNKWEGVSERAFDVVRDRVADLEVPVATERSDRGWVDARVVFGVDAKGVRRWESEVEREGREGEDGHRHDHQSEIEVLSVTVKEAASRTGVDVTRLQQLLEQAPKDEVYRIKAVLFTSQSPKSSDGQETETARKDALQNSVERYVLNWAFGRWKYTRLSEQETSGESPSALRMTIMTARDESNSWKKRIESKELIRAEDGNSIVEIRRVT